jgi:hypothetical protein
VGWLAFLATTLSTVSAMAQTRFRHPGILHTQEDLDRMRKMVLSGAEPWASGFQKLKGHSQSSADWKVLGPFESAVRGPSYSRHRTELDLDANAAYQNALMWCITRDEAHARKTTEILDGWAGQLKTLDGRDVELMAGFDGFKLASAAELLRYTWTGWKPEKVAAFTAMLTNVFLPRVKNFATFANGNWDGACMKCVMAIAVFSDDPAQFERVVDYFYRGKGNGCLTHYVVNDAGQCQESGRDQAHTQLGLGQLAEVCQIAWNQGIDLYAAESNRLLKGFEYTAKYNLGQEVAFQPHLDATGHYKASVISSLQRGYLRPIYEMVWNHYHVRRGIAAPYSGMAAAKTRPEGAAPFSDHAGFGTLLFSLEPAAPGSAPGEHKE